MCLVFSLVNKHHHLNATSCQKSESLHPDFDFVLELHEFRLCDFNSLLNAKFNNLVDELLKVRQMHVLGVQNRPTSQRFCNRIWEGNTAALDRTSPFCLFIRAKFHTTHQNRWLAADTNAYLKRYHISRRSREKVFSTCVKKPQKIKFKSDFVDRQHLSSNSQLSEMLSTNEIRFKLDFFNKLKKF
jgi:hypothetical protein